MFACPGPFQRFLGPAPNILFAGSLPAVNLFREPGTTVEVLQAHLRAPEMPKAKRAGHALKPFSAC